MHFHIRTALPSDYPAIYQLNKEEMGYDYPLEETKAKLAALLQQEGDQIFVAVAKGLVVGYLHLRDYDVLYAPHMKDVMGIAVSSRYQRMGIGRRPGFFMKILPPPAAGKGFDICGSGASAIKPSAGLGWVIPCLVGTHWQNSFAAKDSPTRRCFQRRWSAKGETDRFSICFAGGSCSPSSICGATSLASADENWGRKTVPNTSILPIPRCSKRAAIFLR